MITFKIRGVLREAETDLPLGGLYVKAYDEDLAFDDLLGSAVSDEHGRFQIISEHDDFRGLFEQHPDLYFKVSSADGETLLKRSETLWNWRPTGKNEIVIR